MNQGRKQRADTVTAAAAVEVGKAVVVAVVAERWYEDKWWVWYCTTRGGSVKAFVGTAR
jgi:hypothetical protein